MNKEVTIVILSLIIIVLIGLLFLNNKKVENQDINQNPKIEFKKVNAKSEQDCVNIALEINKKRDECKKIGTSNLYGYNDGINCLDIDNHFDNPVCTDLRSKIELEIKSSCLELFPKDHFVLAECLANLE